MTSALWFTWRYKKTWCTAGVTALDTELNSTLLDLFSDSRDKRFIFTLHHTSPPKVFKWDKLKNSCKTNRCSVPGLTHSPNLTSYIVRVPVGISPLVAVMCNVDGLILGHRAMIRYYACCVYLQQRVLLRLFTAMLFAGHKASQQVLCGTG